MKYDVIGYGGEYLVDYNFYTIGNLMNIARQYPEHIFRFVGSEYSPEKLMSWRGDYSQPTISYSSKPMNGKELLGVLLDCLAIKHYGYKGGEYRYHDFMEFYVSAYGSSEDYKVCGYDVGIGEVILLTVRDPH